MFLKKYLNENYETNLFIRGIINEKIEFIHIPLCSLIPCRVTPIIKRNASVKITCVLVELFFLTGKTNCDYNNLM